MIQRLGGLVTDTVMTFVGVGDSVRVLLRPMEAMWYMEGGILQSVRESGWIPTQSPSASLDVELGLLSVRVNYANARRKGLFEAKVFDRTVSIEFSAKVVQKNSGAIILNQTFARSASDIVDASEFEELENPAIPSTHGVPPTEGFFSTIIEPLVALGAIAVAVYLLFHVRS